ncbi:MAG: helix-turn-helix transcriptional regulator, partial [Ignavibacteriaceae bacterium]
ETKELFNHINTFKFQLKQNEVKLLNYLIDEKTRYEIAEEINLNLNTLDTHIRRLRIKFSRFLRKSGYSGGILDKYK